MGYIDLIEAWDYRRSRNFVVLLRPILGRTVLECLLAPAQAHDCRYTTRVPHATSSPGLARAPRRGRIARVGGDREPRDNGEADRRHARMGLPTRRRPRVGSAGLRRLEVGGGKPRRSLAADEPHALCGLLVVPAPRAASARL